jgi:glycosyltransferase involved in cell wall biosynthesis
MIRVLHVVGGLNVGGTETWLVKGLAAVDREQYQFDFLVHGDGPQHYAAGLVANGARILRCPDPRHLVKYVRTLMRILSENRYHVVHAHTYCFSGVVLAIAAAAGVPVRIFQSHTAQDESQRHGLRRFYFVFTRELIRRFATLGIAVSEEAALPMFPANWKRHPERWKISPIGIDLTPFQVPVDRDCVRDELGIPAAAKVFVHVGRFVPVKNHESLVQVARAVLRRDRNAVWLLVGDGAGRPGIEERVRSLGISANFRFAGLRSDVARLLRASNVFLLPSLYEGFPLSYVEAQAAGLPCVISDVIAQAADLVPDRTWRCSLQSPPEVWAEVLLRAAELGRSEQMPEQLRAVSIEGSMKRMVECYR